MRKAMQTAYQASNIILMDLKMHYWCVLARKSFEDFILTGGIDPLPPGTPRYIPKKNLAPYMHQAIMKSNADLVFIKLKNN